MKLNICHSRSAIFSLLTTLIATAALVITPASARAQAIGSVLALHNFNGLDGSGPEQGMIRASDGNFYGVVAGGGMGDNGTIYKLTPAGQFSVLHKFQNQLEGTLPKAIIQGTDGNLYGVTRGGGTSVVTPAGGGTFFRLALNGAFTKLHDFDRGIANEGLFPSAIVQGSDGNFYGLTRDGGNTATGGGTFFRLSANGVTRTQLFAFQSGNGPGYRPEAQLLKASDGNFYGVTTTSGATGGTPSLGTLFRATTAGAVTPLHVFLGSDAPRDQKFPLVQGSDGFYGTSAGGGQHDFGTIYKVASNGTFTLLHEFQDPDIDGTRPFGLVRGSDGNFYGSTQQGFPPNPGSLDFGKGSYYQITPGGVFRTIVKTPGVNNGPANPSGPLIEIGPRVFAGVTGVGGPSQDGTVIRLSVSLSRSDLNRDSAPDYVLHNASTNHTAVWYLNRNSLVSTANGPTLPAGWKLVDVADFNVDGKPDYVLFNPATRQTSIWYLSGATLLSTAAGPTVSGGYVLLAALDLNNDRKPDFVLYNPSTRRTVIWYLNGTAFSSGVLGPILASGYTLAGVADFDGDGRPDFALFNAATRATAIWYLSGPTLLRGASGPGLASGYQLAGVADFNRDGKPDFLLLNPSTRQTVQWYLNNNALISGLAAPTLAVGFTLATP